MALKPSTVQVDFTSTWNSLKVFVQGVMELRIVPREVWNDRFTDVYNLCHAYPESPAGEHLYLEIKEFLYRHVTKLHEYVSNPGKVGISVLSAYYIKWAMYSQSSKHLNELFKYLNLQVLKKNELSGLESREQMLQIEELGLYVWKRIIISDRQLVDSLVSSLLHEINQDRCGFPTNKKIIRKVFESFVSERFDTDAMIELYENALEKPIVIATGEYYKKLGSILLQEYPDCSSYMAKLIQKQDEENQRCEKFFHPDLYEKVMSKCRESLVADHLILQFLHRECASMVRQERTKDLRNMYWLLKPVSGGLPALINELQSHMTSKAMEAVTNLKGDNVPAQFVENFLKIHRTSNELIQEVFDSDEQFVDAVKRAFTAVINHRPADQKQPCPTPELLAKYCHSLLKKGASVYPETDDKLANSITVFKYIVDKDLFEKHYENLLAQRLLCEEPVSMDTEKGMINRLTQECGDHLTEKMRMMLTDMTLSSDLNKKFINLGNSKSKLGLTFSIRVLKACEWPLSESIVTEFVIPQQLEKSIHQFEQFYSSRFNGRKLTWIHHMSTAQVKLCYLKKSFVVTMSTYQMAIMLIFESTNSLTYQEIQESTMLNPQQLNENLKGLIGSKLLVSSQPTLTDTADLTLNLDFTNERTKIKIINQNVLKEQLKTVEQTRVRVDEDRELCVEASIVRIMKRLKSLRHNALIEEVKNQPNAKFVPSTTMIKKCTEKLIEKDYIQRTHSPETKEDGYIYVA